MNRILFCFITLCICSNLNAKEFKPYYHQVSLKSGDGITVILERYELNGNTCNTSTFYQINNLKAKSPLLKGKKYYLPIKVYKYNGKSIKSTLDVDIDVARAIQKYNENLLTKGLRQESFTKNNLLWVPQHLIGCSTSEDASTKKSNAASEAETREKPSIKKEEVSEIKETKVTKSSRKSGEIKVVDLFGPKYKEVEMWDNQLQGQVFYISSGHGGPDPGAQCTELEKTLCEDEYAYDVALRLARDLTQHGAVVHMIIKDENDGIRDEAFLDCDTDESCNGRDLPYRQLDRLKQRADHINRLYQKHANQGVKKQTAIMIHVDSANKEHRQDVFFYHYGDNKVSKDMAYELKATFERKYDIFQKGRGYKGYVANRGLYMLRNVKPDAVFVELANIRNQSDHIRLMESSNRQALANWLFEGLTGIQ